MVRRRRREFLSQRALSIIEISLMRRRSRVVRRAGLSRSSGDTDRWLRTVSRTDKMQALAAMRTTRRPSRDLNVRELETIDVPQSQPAGGFMGSATLQNGCSRPSARSRSL